MERRFNAAERSYAFSGTPGEGDARPTVPVCRNSWQLGVLDVFNPDGGTCGTQTHSAPEDGLLLERRDETAGPDKNRCFHVCTGVNVPGSFDRGSADNDVRCPWEYVREPGGVVVIGEPLCKPGIGKTNNLPAYGED